MNNPPEEELDSRRDAEPATKPKLIKKSDTTIKIIGTIIFNSIRKDIFQDFAKLLNPSMKKSKALTSSELKTLNKEIIKPKSTKKN